MITVLAQVTARPGKEAELRAMFEAQVARVRLEEPRTSTHAIYTTEDRPGVFFFFEQYEDEAARAAHNTAPYIQADVARLGNLTTDDWFLHRLDVVAEVRR
ncbi:MAG: hypothetical protein EXR64_04730 [Dehalococcoidia bacterium]|nr:hypothetical protein [Dehalococcoidia bacterium]